MKHNNSKGQVTAQVTLDEMGRTGFDYDNVQYGTGRIGRLYPVRCDFVYPDDTYKSDTTAVLNFKPLLVPLMTNMHVKQEHFYVPFNTVWDNWDLFISNGEENDYNGVVPSISMDNILDAINNIVTNNGVFPIFNTGFSLYGNMHLNNAQDKPTWQTQPYISIPEYFAFWNGQQLPGLPITYLQNFDFDSTPLAQWLKSRQMDDLYDHVQPLVEQMCEYILNMRRIGENALFRPISSYFVASNAVDSDANANHTYSDFFKLRTSEIDAVDNRYLRKIAPALDNLVNSEGYIPFVPTLHGMNLLRMLYDVYRPIIGLSSNLDMLGYNKLRFEDFLYVIMVQILTSYKFTLDEASNNVQVDIALSSTHFQSIGYQVVLSGKPQSILPLRGLYSIWLNNYRDQLLETDAPKLSKSDSITDDEILTLITPRLRCWHKDAFTTSLDNPGTGNVGVTLNVRNLDGDELNSPRFGISKINDLGIGLNANTDNSNLVEISIDGKSYRLPTSYISGINSIIDVKDAAPVEGFSLFQLDAARRAQKFLQKALFYGNRIQDFLFSHWQVKFLDARLRLPELVATSSDMVQMQQIVANNTIVTEKSTNVAGDKAGYAYSQAFTNNIDHYIPEHGVVISMLSVIPDCVYSNTFDRHLAMLDQFDFPFPDFATLGMQAVYENEMMQLPVKIPNQDSVMSDDVAVHGYQGMYYADKSKFNNVHGELLDTENVYVMDREFNPYDLDARPKLNYVFVHCHPKLDAFVIDNEWSDYFRFDVYHNQGINRKLPAHSIYI